MNRVARESLFDYGFKQMDRAGSKALRSVRNQGVGGRQKACAGAGQEA